MNKLSLALGTGALTLSLALAGCSSATADPAPADSRPSEPASPAASNAADQMFVTMMIPHHQQAVEMSAIVLEKDGLDPAVAELAEKITAAQQPEIDRMLGWLKAWGVAYDPDSGGMHHGSGDDGMMSAEDMGALKAADGAEAGRLFLEQMIAHHEGAVEMARVELDAGRSTEAVALARQVIEDQTTEIETMRRLARTL